MSKDACSICQFIHNTKKRLKWKTKESQPNNQKAFIWKLNPRFQGIYEERNDKLENSKNEKIMKINTLKCGMGLNFTGIFFALNAYIIGKGWKWILYPISEVIKCEIKKEDRQK